MTSRLNIGALARTLGKDAAFLAVLAATLVCASAPRADAQAATVTTLAITSGGSAVTTVTQGTVVTLTATVKAGGVTLTRGLVNFCVVSTAACTDVHLLGSAQLTKAGKAVIKLRAGPGSHSWKAVYAGTTGQATSASGAAALTVTVNTEPDATFTQVGEVYSQSGSAYELQTTVFGGGNEAPTGEVSFLDVTKGNAVLATASLSSLYSGPMALTANVSNPQVGGEDQAGGYANALAVADFNGDGIPDIASVNDDTGDDGSVTILLGNGDGTFTAAPNSPATGSNLRRVTTIAVADFNQDGIPDLAVSNPWGGSGITILLGNGDGTFTPAASLNVGNGSSEATCVAVGDFNGDGIPDIVASPIGDQWLITFLGNGDGTFTQVSQVSALLSPTTPTQMIVADLNGDGILDLATYEDLFVTILLGVGDGTFSAVSSNYIHGAGIVEGDFNEDGIPDLAAGAESLDSGPGSEILLNNGDGTFTETGGPPSGGELGAFAPVVGDFNGDGHADLDVNGVIIAGAGNGTFTSSGELGVEPGSPYIWVAADFTGAGKYGVAETGGGIWPTVAVSLLESWEMTGQVTGIIVGPPGSGQHHVVASYPGDSNNLPSVSSTSVTLTAPMGTPTVTVNVPSGPVYYGSTVTFAAAVSGTGFTPTGSVNFYNGKTPLGTVALNSSGGATLSTSTLAAGSHSITVSYQGDTNYLKAVSAPVTVTIGPSAVITSPSAGSTLTGSTTTFTWSTGFNATAYQLWVGSTGVNSNNLYSSGSTTATSKTVKLPVNGETLYVRLFTNNSGTWTSINYTYNAAAQAVLKSPAPGSTLTGASVTFTWSAATPAATAYELWVGSTGVGSNNIYSSGSITATSATPKHLPTNGETVYVRLYTELNGTWVHTDYTYKAE